MATAYTSSVSRYASDHFHRRPRCLRYGAPDALYRRCRRLTMNVVKTITIPGAPVPMSCAATNWAEPAKTTKDMAKANVAGSPALNANTP